LNTQEEYEQKQFDSITSTWQIPTSLIFKKENTSVMIPTSHKEISVEVCKSLSHPNNPGNLGCWPTCEMPYINLPILLALSCETYLQEFCNISDNISEDKFFLVTVKPPKFADPSKKSHQGLNNKIWKFGPSCQVIQNIIT
jgi:hypothetical protein